MLAWTHFVRCAKTVSGPDTPGTHRNLWWIIDPVTKSRRAQKPHKLCFFCGLPAPMSDEHAWPQWLGQGIELEPTQTTRTIGYGRTAEDAMTEAPNVVVRKKGSVLTARIREVCKNCNNGWMSRLETAARPLLERLCAQSYVFGRTTFSLENAATLATWSTKTAWVRERASNQIVTPTPQMRLHLKEQLLPPDFTRVWVARHQGRINFGAQVGQVETTHQDDRWDGDRLRHILMCVMTFRGVSVLVRTDDGWGAPQFSLPPSHWRLIWPLAGTLEWPPPESVTDNDVQTLATRYNWLRHPDVPIFHRDPNGIQTIERN